MTESVGVVLATPGRQAGLLCGMRRGEWWVEKAGVVGAVAVVVGDAPESLASKTVAVRGRGRGGCRCRGCGEEESWLLSRCCGRVQASAGWVFEVRLQVQQQRKRTLKPRSLARDPGAGPLSLVGRHAEDRRVENVDQEA